MGVWRIVLRRRWRWVMGIAPSCQRTVSSDGHVAHLPRGLAVSSQKIPGRSATVGACSTTGVALRPAAIDLEITRVIEGAGVTHLTFRVVK
jgi:hypothetical protein